MHRDQASPPRRPGDADLVFPRYVRGRAVCRQAPVPLLPDDMRRPTFADSGVASVLGEDGHCADGMRLIRRH
jgi:hypothetical protein